MKKLRILIVDDEEPVLRACARTLQELPNAEVVQQNRSRLAAEILASQSFDLLVSDIRMPELDGIELLRLAHRYHPDLPVILITGFPTPGSQVAYSQSQAAAYLMKPIVPEKLLATVRKVLGERSGQSVPLK